MNPTVNVVDGVEVWSTGNTARVFRAVDYGSALDAVADGSGNWSGTDDTAAIQATIDAAEAAGGGVVSCPGHAVCESSLTVESDEVVITGAAKRASSIRFGPSAGFTVPGESGSYLVTRLSVRDLLLGPKNSEARSVPVVDLVGVNAFDFRRVTIQGDTLKSQPAFRSRWAISGLFDTCDIQGGLSGVDAGTVSGSANAFTFVNSNINGCRTGILGAFAGFTMLGGTVQSCGDGIKISSDVAESSSTVVVDGTYFENNKFHDGTSFTGRDITLGDDAIVRSVTIRGYFATLADDNAFTDGQGASDLAPVRLKRVQGFEVSSFAAGYGSTGIVELAPVSVSGHMMPRSGEILASTSMLTDTKDAVEWASGTTESQKFQVFRDESVQVRGWSGPVVGREKVVTSPPVTIDATGDVAVPWFVPDCAFGELREVRLLTADALDVTGTVSVGISVSSGFHVNAQALGSEAANTNRALTLNNTRTRSTTGTVAIRVSTSAVTTAGSFVLQARYHSAVE